MDIQLRTSLLVKNGVLQTKKLWENTFIKKQIDRRNSGQTDFRIQEHIRAMVYSMLSSGIIWERVESSIDEETGKISAIDENFHQYNPDFLLTCSENELTELVKKVGGGSQSTRRQMNGLIHTNIRKMMILDKKYGSIDRYYQKFINNDQTMKSLIKALSDPSSKDKYVQMAEALNAEYLRNVGYDIAKSDRHICRILGNKHLGCSNQDVVPIYESFDIIRELAEHLGRGVAEVDYILWSYCANGYGKICVENKWNCRNCVAKEICKSPKTYNEV